MLHEITESVFWLSALALFYAYLGYPALLAVLRWIMPVEIKAENARPPSVSMLIAAYNEERVIAGKLENCLAIDYPGLAVWVVSDGSTDKTNSIVSGYAGKNAAVHLIELARSGKSAAINSAMPLVDSDIVVFSDANTFFDRDALVRLLGGFKDPRVGFVCGRLIYNNPNDVASGHGEGLYWRYETALKRMESALGYVAGANGAIYAIRRELFEPLPKGAVNDDFTISMRIIERGWYGLYAPEAIAREDVALSMASEFRRHVRDSAGHYKVLLALYGLLNPLLGMRSFIFISHRVFRWAAPPFILTLLLSNILMLGDPFYNAAFILQGAFYSAALLGLACKNAEGPGRIVLVPFYFCNLNAALVAGFLKAVSGRQGMTWERTERI